MLTLGRRVGEKIVIGDNIVVEVVRVRGNKGDATVHLGITAPREIVVDREEVRKRKGKKDGNAIV